MRSLKTRVALMALLLGVIVASQCGAYSATEYFAYLKSVFNQHEKKLGDYLLGELKTYITQFPGGEDVPEASFMMGQIMIEQRDQHAAFALFMRTLFLYPRSDIHSRVVDEVHRIVSEERAYMEKASRLREIIDGEFTTGEGADRFHAYLSFLHDLDEPKLYEWSLREYQEFIGEYVADRRTEEVQRWLAETYVVRNRPLEAETSFLKYEHLYPDNPHVPDVKYRRAGLLADKVKDYEGALALYTEEVDGFPGTEYAGSALFASAQLKAKKNRDYEGAVADYRRLVTDLPQHPQSLDALLAIAEIRAGKQKEYSTAVAVYDEVVASFPTNRKAIDALLEAADILAGKLKDYTGAAERYANVSALFPEHEQAPRMLFKAADICAGKLKDYEKAIEYYQYVIDQYPGTDHARKAEKNVAKLREKQEG